VHFNTKFVLQCGKPLSGAPTRQQVMCWWQPACMQTTSCQCTGSRSSRQQHHSEGLCTHFKRQQAAWPASHEATTLRHLGDTLATFHSAQLQNHLAATSTSEHRIREKRGKKTASKEAGTAQAASEQAPNLARPWPWPWTGLS